LTTHPAAPVAPRTRSGVLGVSRGGATKGSRLRARFPTHFSVKMRHPARAGAKSRAVGAQTAGTGRGRAGLGPRAPNLAGAVRLSWPDVKPVETTTTRHFR
jgi:hypothetical protein